ncbi:MAG TPA: peptide deformylase [Candidatus Sulfotelmatobacter sp.]|nr:peptide deformylase [Candidatus Sulfotelmatobacter sp.]
MPIRAVRLYGDPVLRQRAAEVTEFDGTLKALLDEMRETMKAYNGVGLAANQIGVLQRVAVVDVPREDGPRERYVLINPVIESRSGTIRGEEGCLSIPGIWEDVTRSKKIRVSARNEQGQPFELEAEDYLSRAIQHEVDHLDGVLFVDRLSALKRQFLRRPLEALARGELPEDYKPPAEMMG